MNDDQRRMARHALGLPNVTKRSYRNRYCSPKRGREHAGWTGLVAQGLATDESYGPLYSRSTQMFWLTHQGAMQALEPGERLDPEDFPAAREQEAEHG